MQGKHREPLIQKHRHTLDTLQAGWRTSQHDRLQRTRPKTFTGRYIGVEKSFNAPDEFGISRIGI
jgi:hypothetical protein